MKKTILIHDKRLLVLVVFTILLVHVKAQTSDSPVYKTKNTDTCTSSKTHTPFRKDKAGKNPFRLPAATKVENNDEKIKDSILKKYKF
jgi:hypothetical protein